jgi:hypothetical protein
MSASALLAQTRPMAIPHRVDLAEVTITATLLSVYAGARGTARALGAVLLLLR